MNEQVPPILRDILDDIEKANAYANAMVKRDQLARHEGRPEHDTTTSGMPLKPGQ